MATPVLHEEETLPLANPTRTPTRNGARVGNAKRRKTSGFALAILSFLGVLAVIAVTVGLILLNQPKRVDVPQTVGLSREEASAKVTAAGFQVAFGDPIVNDQCVKDKVAEQNPPGGRKADEHATVTLRICTGPGQTSVPVLQGLTRENAERALEQAGLVAKFDEVDNEAPAGQVLSSNPAAGKTVEKGTTVTVQVSKGNQVLVPNLIGLTRTAALARLTEVGLVGQVVQGDQVSPADADKVSNQNPKKDTKVTKGSTVRIFVDYAASPEPPQSPSPEPSPSQ